LAADDAHLLFSAMANNANPEIHGSLDELRRLLGQFDTAMLVTVSPEHRVHARPMAVQEPARLPGCDLWFVTAEETDKVHDIEHQAQVGVTCYRALDSAWLAISARAEVLRDRTLVERLWQPSWKVWFPDGPNGGPPIAILRLTVERAEYWEPGGGRLRVLYEILRSKMRGRAATEGLPPTKRI
jgi:general stress protein 26